MDATVANMSHSNMSRVSAATRPYLNRRRSIDDKFFGMTLNKKDSIEEFLNQMDEEMHQQEMAAGETTGKKSKAGSIR